MWRITSIFNELPAITFLYVFSFVLFSIFTETFPYISRWIFSLWNYKYLLRFVFETETMELLHLSGDIHNPYLYMAFLI